MLANVFEGLIKEFLVASVFAVSAFSLAVVFLYIPLRKKKLRFFGVTRENSDYDIYVSRLMIKKGGTEAFEKITNGYHGAGIIKIEYEGAMLFHEELGSEALSRIPKRFRDWLKSRMVVMSNLKPRIDVSPDDERNISSNNLFLIGSGIYNIASKKYLEYPGNHFMFFKNDDGSRGVRFRIGGMKGQEIPGRDRELEIGIVQRINEHSPRRTIFICAGQGASASYGCARHLVEHWKEIYKEYGDEEFSICLSFQVQDLNNDIPSAPEVVFRSRID